MPMPEIDCVCHRVVVDCSSCGVNAQRSKTQYRYDGDRGSAGRFSFVSSIAAAVIERLPVRLQLWWGRCKVLSRKRYSGGSNKKAAVSGCGGEAARRR